MSTREAAAYLGISVFYLRNMRHRLHSHDGPRCTRTQHKHGPGWSYERADLDTWARTHLWKSAARRTKRKDTGMANVSCEDMKAIAA